MKRLLQCVLLLAFVLPCVACAQFLTLGGQGVQSGSGPLSPIGSVVASATNADDTLASGSSPGDWKPVCIETACSPGGSGVPTATSQTINNASPSKDGESMYMSVSANNSSSYTNALWVNVAGNCDTCTRVNTDFSVYINEVSSYAGSWEFDTYIFDKTNGYKNMWGRQCVNGGYWQIDSDFGWTNTNVACSFTVGWHHIQFFGHRVIGQTGGSQGYGYNYYDGMIIDGTTYNWTAGCGISSGVNYNAGYCSTPAEAYPSGYTQSVSGFQFQLDAAPNASAVTMDEYLDEANYYGGN